MEISLNTGEAIAAARAAKYWLETWPNEDMNPDLESFLEKLEEEEK